VTAAHVVSDPYDLRYQGELRKMEQSDIEWYVAQGAIYLVLQETDPDVLKDLTQEDLDDLTNEALSSGSVGGEKCQFGYLCNRWGFPRKHV